MKSFLIGVRQSGPEAFSALEESSAISSSLCVTGASISSFACVEREGMPEEDRKVDIRSGLHEQDNTGFWDYEFYKCFEIPGQ